MVSRSGWYTRRLTSYCTRTSTLRELTAFVSAVRTRVMAMTWQLGRMPSCLAQIMAW